MKPEKKRGGTVLMVVGALLILAAALLVHHNVEQSRRAGAEAALILTELEKSTSFTQLEMPDAEMPVVSIDGRDYIGELVIKPVSKEETGAATDAATGASTGAEDGGSEGDDAEEPLKLPIMAYWDDEASWTAPGRYAGSAYDDSMVICGHNMPSHFAVLPELIEGDKVMFTDVNGNVFLYEVAQIYNLKPTQVADMLTGDWDLTLFTCTLSGTERVTVRCRKVEE